MNVSPIMLTLVFALLDAAARMSAKCAESSAVRPNAVRASVTMSDVVARSSPDAAARCMMPSMPESMSPVFQPAIAMYDMASAASDALNLVFSPISRALSRRACRSSPVAPEIAATLAMALSKSAAVFTAATPRPVTAAEATEICFPAFVMLSPAFSNLSPAAAIFSNVTLVVAACSCRRLSSCSVSTISRWRASYLSCPSSPRSSCSFACFCASFRVSSFSLVEAMASFRSFCFWVNSSVFVGSSFKRRSTSFNADCVVFMELLTPFKAFSRPVVSPPISTVIPFILLAITVHLP